MLIIFTNKINWNLSYWFILFRKNYIKESYIFNFTGTTTGLLSFPLTSMNSAKHKQRLDAKLEKKSYETLKPNEFQFICGFKFLKCKFWIFILYLYILINNN